MEEEEEEARIGGKDLWELKRRVGGAMERKEKDCLWMEADDDAAEERAVEEGGVCKVSGISGFRD